MAPLHFRVFEIVELDFADDETAAIALVSFT